MICPKCGFLMEDLGNVSGKLLLTNPPTWDKIHICRGCKLQKSEWCRGPFPQVVNLNEYTNADDWKMAAADSAKREE